MLQTIKKTHRLLLKKHATVSVAESCTGGLMSETLTRLAGSSAYFLLGVAAYSNQAKQKILGIPSRTLRKFGAVSEEVAKLLAQKVRRKTGATVGIGITGIAGPAGGTAEKPIGTVFISAESPKGLFCKRYRFNGSRSSIRRKTVQQALVVLARILREYRSGRKNR